MLKITILFNRVWFPPDQANKIAKSYIDWLKNNPPDKTIEKTICIAISADEQGYILVYGISEIMKGKEKEALANTTEGNLFLASKMDGLRFKTEVLMDFNEAYKVLGMAPPPEV
ncbi:MAG: hypothetical protein ACFE91_16545 [Promethearchaeota archaeon]